MLYRTYVNYSAAHGQFHGCVYYAIRFKLVCRAFSSVLPRNVLHASCCCSVSVFVCLHVTSCSAGHVRQCTSHCPAHQGIMPAGPSRYVCLSHCLSVHLSVCFTKRGYVVCAVWEVIPTDFSRLYVAVCVRVSE